MIAYDFEYNDVDLRITDQQLHQFLQELDEASFSYSVSEDDAELCIHVHLEERDYLFLFRKMGDEYQLRTKNIQIPDKTLSDLFQKTLTANKGHAIMKVIGPDYLLIHNIQFGEAVRITEITGEQKKVLLDKEWKVTIKDVMEAFRRRDVERRIPKLRKELDEELDRLHLALEAGNQKQIEECKKRLKKLRREMLLCEL